MGRASFRYNERSEKLLWAAWGAALSGILMGRNALGKEAVPGRWTSGPLLEEVTVREWLSACGPAPSSRTSPGGEEFNVSTDAGELTFTPVANGENGEPSKSHRFTSNGCYEQLPALSQESHSFDVKRNTWRTRCATPVGDPRRIVVQSLLSSEVPTRVSLAETVHYEIKVAEGTCIADVKRTRTWSALAVAADVARPVVNGGTAAPIEPTQPEQAPSPRSSGPSSRTWFLVIVFGSAAILASVWAMLAVRKRRADRREAMEHQRRAEERRREREERVRAATGAKAEHARAARAALREARALAGPMSCPTCKREFANELTFCPYDANRLVPLNEAKKSGPPGGICPACKRGFNPGVLRCPHDDEELEPYLRGVNEVDDEAPRGLICPTCSTKSDGKGTFCVRDGTPLAPLN